MSSKYVRGQTDSDIPATMPQGELRRRIASRVGTNPERYAADLGVERHKRLTADDVHGVAAALGMGLSSESRQQTMDAIMIRTGRDHRTGVNEWDSSDLRAVLAALRGDDDE